MPSVGRHFCPCCQMISTDFKQQLQSSFYATLDKIRFFPAVKSLSFEQRNKHFLQPFCSTVHDHRSHKLLNRMACTIPHVTETNQSVCLVNDLGGNFPAASPGHSRGYFAIFVVGRTDNERKKCHASLCPKS